MEVQVQSVTYSTVGMVKRVRVFMPSREISQGWFEIPEVKYSGSDANGNIFHTNYGPFSSINVTSGMFRFGVKLITLRYYDPFGVEIDQMSVRFSESVTLEDLSCP